MRLWFLLIGLLVVLTPAVSSYAQPALILFLDKSNGILLPKFNTDQLKDAEVESITLSLFVLDSNTSGNVNFIVYPFDAENSSIGEYGLSVIQAPQKNEFLNVRLPVELFENFNASNKQLLIQVVNPDVKLVFQGTLGSVGDPQLVVESRNDSVSLQDLKRKFANESIVNINILSPSFFSNDGGYISEINLFNIEHFVLFGSLIGNITLFLLWKKKK